MDEGIAVFLPILYSFLNGHWTSACSSDDDCLDSIERCCKVRREGKISCVNRVNCGDFCYDLADCSAPERCDIYNNLISVQQHATLLPSAIKDISVIIKGTVFLRKLR